MSQHSLLSVLALAIASGSVACATSADPGFGGSTSTDTGVHHDTSVEGDGAGSDVFEPSLDTAEASDSGITKGDTSVGSDTGSTAIDTGLTPDDTGSIGTDTAPPPFDTTPPPTDTAPPIDSGGTTEGTTGTACSAATDCDPLGTAVNSCSDTFFGLGPIDPAPVCVGLNPPECSADDGTTIIACDGTLGVCLASGTNELCLPACTFDNSGAAPTGCVGKDVCHVYGYGSGTGTVEGVGYCFGGCKVNADCPASSKCQVEEGICVTTKATYTKASGTACTMAADAGTTPTCNCLYGASNKGYCANFCTVGSSTCSAGYTCSPQLPTSDTTGPLFTTDPSGIAGNCLKTCTVAADCTAINSKCTATATGKVCVPN